ncbi:organic cation transporter protein [Diprion similis]|uniref:organic cation transporter protein n=1 Tax=Diprion similis TaxID=362088 RepID=UPI001EF93370|nr:organic cation transporter protein [Diprion similis]
MGHDNDIEELMSHMGDFGRYQAWQFFLHVISALTAGIHMMTLVMVAAVPDHRCAIPGLDNENFTAPWNSTEVIEAIPTKSKGGLENCLMFKSGSNVTVECDSWVYDRTYYQSSRAIEWDFVCSQRWMGALSQSAYMLGVFAGAVCLGSMADKYGRKIIFYISAVAQLVFGVTVALVPEYYTFLGVRFLYGIFGSAGAYITGFVLTMEIVGPSKRTICGVAFQATFALGIMLVAAWGSLIKDRMWLQIVYGLHSVLLIGHWWLIDESPRWLWAQGRVKEAVAIIKRGLRMNGNNMDIDVAHYVSRGKASQATKEERECGVLDLFKTPNLRKKSLNICLNWFANSIAYYGLSLSTGSLLGNPFLMLFLSGLVEIPSYVMIVNLMDRTGRRSLVSILMILGGICSIVVPYIPRDVSGGAFVVIIGMLGKFLIAGSFAVTYNYSAELFPTVLRNTALGVGSMSARISGAMTPMIILLDTLDPRVPSVIFGCLVLVSGFLALYLPETLNQPMPQTLEDGETFGVGDTCFTTCFGSRSRDKTTYDVALQDSDYKEISKDTSA